MKYSRFVLIFLLILPAVSFPTDRAIITGKITDNSGKPLKDATVIVWAAGVKNGYSTYCPGCYRDCGKRATTDTSGSFTIANLDSDLWFQLLVVREGYTPTFIKGSDPATGPKTASLAPRAKVDDPRRVVRGRVVDQHGRALRGVVVQPEGIRVGDGSMYGGVPGLERVAVTDSRGRFELSYSKEAKAMLLNIEARGMATKFTVIPTGLKRQTITLFDGAVIRGRLLNQGKPVPGAEIGLIAQERGGFGPNLELNGNPYREIRIGTQDDGSFVIPNVPVPISWYVYAKMESIAAIGATNPVESSTARNGELLNVGDLQIIPGHQVRGKITLSDGTQIPDGMRVTISADRVWDTQTVVIAADGTFEFRSLPAGKYNIFPSVRGYELKERQHAIELTVDEDLASLEIVLDRAKAR
jgi:hypothetical protein